MKNRSLRITSFLIITLGWSYIVFETKLFNGLESQLSTVASILVGLIPAIGLLVMSNLLRTSLPAKKMTLLGEHKVASLFIASIPILLLTLFGVPNELGLSTHVAGFYLGVIVVVYALFEEYGWRGYLQEEFFDQKNKWIGYIFIGFFWYLWHWFFLRNGGAMDLKTNVILLLALIGASAGIGDLAKESKSILICGTFHALGNIVIMFNLIANNISWGTKAVIIAVCIGAYVFLIQKKQRSETNVVLA